MMISYAFRLIFARPNTAVPFSALILLGMMLLLSSGSALARPPNKGNVGSSSEPMNLKLESYYFRVPAQSNCLGEDDELEWLAGGSLLPGESFTFSPAYTACKGHAAAITVVSSWESGSLVLSSTVPDNDFSSWDANQAGTLVTANQVGTSSQLCMFPSFTSEQSNYSITLRNDSTEAVNGIELHGRHENDWSVFYYPRCLNADADGDGWNDSLEHSMANLLYPIGYISGILQPNILWGSNYLSDRPKTPFVNDEIDSYPADLNDDGWIDHADLELLWNHYGQGNGIPLERISPNPGSYWYHENTLQWRRYDLDGDGYVGLEDSQVIEQLLDLPVPVEQDIVAPTSRILSPQNGQSVSKGKSFRIEAHVWDNAALARVEYLVNGKVQCSLTDPIPSLGFESPLYSCWWSVPRRSSQYELQIRVFDADGNSSTSSPVQVSAN